MYCPVISMQGYRKNTKISLKAVSVLAKAENRSITSQVKLLSPVNCNEKLQEPASCTVKAWLKGA
jgi:hypothetical protein